MERPREIHLIPDTDRTFTGIRGASGVDIEQSKEAGEVNLWVTRALAERLADRPRAQEAVTAIYRMAGLPAPGLFVWLNSQVAFKKAIEAFQNVFDGVESQAEWKFCQSVYDRTKLEQRNRFWDDGRLPKQKIAALYSLCEQKPIQFSPHLRALSGLELGKYCVENQAEWASRVGVDLSCIMGGQWAVELIPRLFESEFRSAMELLVTFSSEWRPYRSFALMCERPLKIALDSRVRFHNTKGKAIEYKDGSGKYFLSGIPVDGRFIENPSSLTVDGIESTQNVELRRCYIELYGEERYLKDSGAKIVSVGSKGARLWSRKPLREVDFGEAFQMVEVKNSTPEPDGSYKHYFIRVPPNMKSADEAVAWTFNMSAEEYSPKMET